VTTYDAVVVGAGHNGLVTAGYLARAGLRVVVVERAEEVGGLTRTLDLAPGYRAPGPIHAVGGLRRSVIRDLGLSSHGVRLVRPEVAAFAPDPEGGGIALSRDPHRASEEIKARSPRDAEGFLTLDRRIRSVSSFLAYVAASTPPDLERPSLADALTGLTLGRAFRRLGERARREALRMLPMPAADLVGDFVKEDLLRALLAARGVSLTAIGPWAAGSGAWLLLRSVGGGGAAGDTAFAVGGPGALAGSLASAARAFGAEIRTGSEVVAVTTRGDRATGVALGSGEEIAGRAVVSSADPKRTLGLLDPEVAGPTLLWRARNLRAPGSVAKVNLALDGPVPFRGAEEEALSGRIVVAPGIDHLERAADDAKYGRISEEPFLEVTIPTLSDPSLAPDGGHVVSVLFHSAPGDLRKGRWDKRTRDRVGGRTVKALERYAPGISDRVVALQVLAPPDIQREFGPTNGCVLHLEPGLDQFFAWRPLLGHARHRLAIPGLYLAGSGAHPGGGVTGAPGANAAREILRDLTASLGAPRRAPWPARPRAPRRRPAAGGPSARCRGARSFR
jgi:phytoene dehydrogenase-like protein